MQCREDVHKILPSVVNAHNATDALPWDAKAAMGLGAPSDGAMVFAVCFYSGGSSGARRKVEFVVLSQQLAQDHQTPH